LLVSAGPRSAPLRAISARGRSGDWPRQRIPAPECGPHLAPHVQQLIVDFSESVLADRQAAALADAGVPASV
jgi:hypothetical protein